MQKIDLNDKTILVTGAAGFIGSNLVKRLLRGVRNATIVGLDNVNDYYDVTLKEWRINQLNAESQKQQANANQWVFIKGDIASKETIDKVFDEYHPSVVVNLAAQAGVRYSIDHPDVYIESNIIGFYNVNLLHFL